MNALKRYVVNAAQAKTGLSTGVLVGYAMQAGFGLTTAVLFLIAVFFVFSDWLDFGAPTTAIGMCVLFAALLIASMAWTHAVKKRTRQAAERALHTSAPLALSPPLLSAGLKLGSLVGRRRFLPAALIAALATGVAAEWTFRRLGRTR
jgi:hypothetical protein